MKYTFLTLIAISSLFILSGCTNQPYKAKDKKCKYNPNMTSKQIEKKMDWKYCEESN
ncbi:MAG: hypothetical protein U9Q33_05415 [Campylobacterota bacterium]|nr:hypothetical protein [Campylobacterota bacterium]